MRKFLVYIMTYVLMMFVGLGGVYIFTGNKAPLKAEITIPEPTVMDKMVNNIMQSKNLQLDADLVVNFKGQHYATLSLDVSLDLKDGINDLACSGIVSIEKSGEVYNIDFTYIDNVIYICKCES